PRSAGVATPNRRQDSVSKDLAIPLDLLAGSWQVGGHLSRVDTAFEFRDPDAFFSLNDTDVERLRGRLVASRDLGGRLWLGFGGEWQRSEVTNVSTFGVNLDGADHENLATFLQARYRQGPVVLEAALRRDEHQVFGSETSPSLGLAVRLGGGMRLRASYGQGFRAPSLGELFFPFSGNPDLRAETSESYELALERQTGPWRFSVAAFDSRQENLIEFDPATFVNVNRGGTRNRGAEGEISLSKARLALTANFTYLNAEDESTGKALARRPRESGSFHLVYRPAEASLSLIALYVGRRPDLDPVTFEDTTNGSYTRLDLAARWQRWQQFQPYGRVENLVDEDYDEALGFPAPGRTFVGGVSWTF
ncbi:MAG: TonB-dependent receptor, partial [Acidobacteria bacterium]|nr:TonB-dependent receptor [Acidobacteriota bacterium]